MALKLSNMIVIVLGLIIAINVFMRFRSDEIPSDTTPSIVAPPPVVDTTPSESFKNMVSHRDRLTSATHKVGRSKFTSLQDRNNNRDKYRNRVEAMTPSKLLPARFRGDTEKMTAQQEKYPWMEQYHNTTEKFVRGKNFLDVSGSRFLLGWNPPKKNMNTGDRPPPPVRIYPELDGQWFQRSDIINQDADLLRARLR